MWPACPPRNQHIVSPALSFAGALIVNIALAVLLVMSARPSMATLQLAQVGDPSGDALEVYFVDPERTRASLPRSPMAAVLRERKEDETHRRLHPRPAFAPEPRASGEIADASALRAIYRRQLQARLARTLGWTAGSGPGLPVPACRLRVDQDSAGRIIRLDMETCSRSFAQQDQLLAAVRDAAPLPLPPHAGLHSRQIEIEVGADLAIRLVRDDATLVSGLSETPGQETLRYPE
ncbi:MAG: hypothetical protein EPO25_17785 [Gammaproteobacteria bacterium]|nr:MAG: hypothetical protein EPO25_17785 [Gammaproteobacteria bacterium]